MRKIKLGKDAESAIQEQLHAFKKKFGREPGPGDPIFFDPDVDEPRFLSEGKTGEMRRQACQAMVLAGIDPAFTYAYQKTGRLVTTDNIRYLTPDDLREWRNAIEEYNSHKVQIN